MPSQTRGHAFLRACGGVLALGALAVRCDGSLRGASSGCANGYAAFGDGMVKWPSRPSASRRRVSPPEHIEVPGAPPAKIQWVVKVPEICLALLLDSGILMMWKGHGFDFSYTTDLAPLSNPVGGTYLDGKIYVACFGTWPTPKNDSGLAVVDAVTGKLEATHAYTMDASSHLHNVYAFKFDGRAEVFAAVLGNVWTHPPVAGAGLVRFDRTSQQYVANTTSAPLGLNARSAAQQEDGVIYVLTQEPGTKPTRLVRLVERQGTLLLEGETQLGSRNGGDGGADVFVGNASDVYCTDRTCSGACSMPGKLYHFEFQTGSFQALGDTNIGPNPRYTTRMLDGTIVSCNQGDTTLTVLPEGRAVKLNGLSDVLFFMEL